MPRFRTVCIALLSTLAAVPALAWDAPGHRAITRIAIEGFKKSTPDSDAAWISETDWSIQISDLATMPDRWRNIKAPFLAHLNNPDHYIDVEDLTDIGLTLRTIEPLRHEYAAQLFRARETHPGAGRQPNPKFDLAKTDAYPGFLPQAICENYSKLVSNFKTLRTLEKINDPARKNELAAVRMAIAMAMGSLAHFVGDAAQPLHTTRHHHGWVGDNPNGFTTKKEIHAQIDAETLRKHNLYEAAIRKTVRFDAPEYAQLDRANPWNDVLAHIERSHAQVIPLYTLEKSGELWQQPGAEFISLRLADAAGFLAALYTAAWDSSAPTDDDVAIFVKYDGFNEGLTTPTPAPTPAPSPVLQPAK